MSEQETQTAHPKRRKKNRKRNIIWFNPPFCKGVETRVGRICLGLINKHFPRSYRYNKIFNKNTIKVNYSCLDKMETIIKQFDMKVMRPTPVADPPCDCSNPANCPLQGKCNSPNASYSAKVSHRERGQVICKEYIGISKAEFKKRFRVHNHTFNNRGTPSNTSLSKHIWQIKDAGITDYSIEWSIIK